MKLGKIYFDPKDEKQAKELVNQVNGMVCGAFWLGCAIGLVMTMLANVFLF